MRINKINWNWKLFYPSTGGTEGWFLVITSLPSPPPQYYIRCKFNMILICLYHQLWCVCLCHCIQLNCIKRKRTILTNFFDDSHRKSNNSNTLPWHQNCDINTFFISPYWSARNDSLPLPLSFLGGPPPLSQCTDYICAFITQLYFPCLSWNCVLLFAIVRLYYCKQQESVNRLLRLILCSGAC